MANSKLIVSDLDFETIKTNLKNFLRDQDQFSGFDFEGTNLGTIINLLAYNTHYNSYYLNMMMNENFLDTSKLRSTTVSKAQMLGYTPRSITSASTDIVFTAFSTANPESIVLPKFTKFSTTINGSAYSFATPRSYTLTKRGNGIYQNTISIVQGVPVSFTFVVDKSDPEQKFILPNSNIDISTLVVGVSENINSSDTEFYSYADNFVTVNDQSLVYFLDEIIDGRYRIYFGKSGIGYELQDGNVIRVSGFISDGDAVNGAFAFSLSDDIQNLSSYQLVPISSATGGAPREDIQSIKFNATKHFVAQNRTVTVEDFKVKLIEGLPDVISVDVWGGEDNDPPIYGKVYMSLQPRNSLIVSESLKNRALSIVSNKKLVSIIPEVIDPDYTYLKLDVDVNYDTRKTDVTAATLSTEIKSVIQNYFNRDLKRFYSKFRNSILTREIQNLTIALNSVNIKTTLRKTITPVKGTNNDFVIKFSNRLYHPFENYLETIYSSQFSYTDSNDVIQGSCKLDDLNGIIRVVATISGVRTVINENVGTVDYSTGRVILSNFRPEQYNTDSITIYAIPFSGDILVGKGQILNVNLNDVSINVISELEDNTLTGGSTSVVGTGGGYSN